MSSPAPDGTFLDEPPGIQVCGDPHSLGQAVTTVSASPLWTAFCDRYTRARGRGSIGDRIVPEEPQTACLCAAMPASVAGSKP